MPDGLQSFLITGFTFTAAGSKISLDFLPEMQNFGRRQGVITVYRGQWGGEVERRSTGMHS